MICPKCNKEIEYLKEICSGWKEGKIFINEMTGHLNYEDIEFEGDGNVLEYNCPECDETITSDYEEAEKLLREKDKLKDMINKKIKINKNDKEKH